MKYNEKIKEIRKQKKISQTEIAKKLGMKYQQYQQYENAIHVIPVTYFKEICKILNVSSDYILGLSDEYKELEKKDV